MLKYIALILISAFVLLFSGCGERGQEDNSLSPLPASEQSTTETSAAEKSKTPEIPREPEGSVSDRSALPVMVNTDGIVLRIGMSLAEFEEFYGKPLENGWAVDFRDEYLGAVPLGGMIMHLSTGGHERWTLDSGVKYGMPIDRVRELLGVEDQIVPNDPESESPLRHLTYVYDGGNVVIMCLNNAVSSIAINSDEYYTNGNSLLGTILADESGKGDATISWINLVEMDISCNISHGAAIKLYCIKDSGAEQIVYSAEKAGEGIVQAIHEGLPENGSGTLRIESEGTWSVRVMQHMIPLEEKSKTP